MRLANSLVAFVSLCVILMTACGGGDGHPGESARSTAPRILLEPEGVLEFGQVPLFAEGSPTTIQKLAVVNVGADVLRLGAIEVSAANANSGSSELEVRLPASVSVAPRAGANVIELDVRVTPASLGPKAWQVKVQSNDPERPVVTVLVTARAVTPPPCRFTVSPNRIEIPQLQAPETPTMVVTIANEGAVRMEQCLISDVRLSPDADPAVSLPQGTIARRILGPGESLQVPVRLVPPALSTRRTLAARLEFDVSSSPTTRVAVPVSAEALPGSCIDVVPAELDFGIATAACAASAQSFTVYSRCTSDVVLTGYSIEGAGFPSGSLDCPGPALCPEFQLVAAPSIPAKMKANGSFVSFAVEYRPRDVGSDTGAVRLEFGEVTYAAPLHGQGGEGAEWNTDVFTMDPPPQVDLLLVIDNAASMADDQASLASNLKAVLQYLKLRDLDFQLGVVTADPTAGATLLTGSTHPDPVLTRQTPNLDAQFLAKVNVGSGGVAPPRCLEQAVAALTAPQNAGLLRTNGQLAVVCITDSTDHSPQPVTDYVDQLWSVKGLNRKTLFTFSAIAGFSASCPGDQGRLADAVTLTHGIKQDLCAADWSKAFDAQRNVCCYQDRYFLSTLPVAAQSIEVSVDGVPLPSTTDRGETAWRYDPVSNSVMFEALYQPTYGRTLTIRYPVRCVSG